MTFSVNFLGGLETIVYEPAGTTKTAILTGEEARFFTLIGLRAVSTSGTPTLSLHYYKSTDTAEALIYPATATSTTAATEIDLSGISLVEGDELRATVSATDVDIILTYAVRGGGNG